MYGLRREDISFCVGKLDKRKKPCLIVNNGYMEYKVGQFNDLQTAEDFFTVLDYVCFGNKEDEARVIIERWSGTDDK